jgi:hypothetical protein
LRPHAFYRFLYGDGIPSSGTNHVNTTIQEVSPGLLFGLGSHWSLDYTPTWRIYSSSAFRDTLDHSVRLTGGTTYEDWTLGLVQGYDRSSAPLVETGTQTDLQNFSTALTGSYRFNSKMWVDLALNQNIVSTDDFNDYSQWVTENWLNYQFWLQLNGALGVTVGYVDQSTQPDMAFERFQGRIQWRALDKVTLHIRGGVEVRQFLNSNQDPLINPLAGAAIQYQPFDFTRLTLDVDRTVTASYLQSPATESTAVTANLNQRLIRVLYLDLSGGYRTVEYLASTTTVGRDDDFYVFSVRLSTSFLKQRGTAAVFYQYADNSSSAPGFTFETTQVGFELGYRY